MAAVFCAFALALLAQGDAAKAPATQGAAAKAAQADGPKAAPAPETPPAKTVAPDKAPDTPTAQVVQLVDAPGAEVDKELLEIFLEEAREVVETIAASLETSTASPHDRESLTTIRRGFHTLKGSGRMVGLMDLGEVAWQCEQVLNKWLKEEKPASPALAAFIEHARASFSRWVGELQGNAAAAIDGAQITREAEALKTDHEAPLAHVPVAATPLGETAPVLDAAPLPAPAGEAAAEFDFASLARTEAAPVAELPAEELDFAALAGAAEHQPAAEKSQAAEPVFEFESLDLDDAAQFPLRFSYVIVEYGGQVEPREPSFRFWPR